MFNVNLKDLFKKYIGTTEAQKSSDKSGTPKTGDKGNKKTDKASGENFNKDLSTLIKEGTDAALADSANQQDNNQTGTDVSSPNNQTTPNQSQPTQNSGLPNQNITPVELTGNETKEELEGKKAEIEGEIAQRQAGQEQAQTTFDEAQTAYDEAVTTAAEQEQQMETDIADKETAVSDKEGEISDKESEISDKESLISDIESSIGSLESRISSISSMSKPGENASDAEKSKYNSAQSELSSLKSELAAKKEQLATEKANLETLKEEKTKLEKEKTTLEQELEDLRNQQTELISNNETLISEAQAALDAAQQELNNQEQVSIEIQTLEANLATINAAIAEKENETPTENGEQKGSSDEGTSTEEQGTTPINTSSMEESTEPITETPQKDTVLGAINEIPNLDGVLKETILNGLDVTSDISEKAKEAIKDIKNRLVIGFYTGQNNIPSSKDIIQGALNLAKEAKRKISGETADTNDEFATPNAAETTPKQQTEAQEEECLIDPIGIEGQDGTRYDFIVDDGNFDSASDFLGSSEKGIQELLDLDFNKDQSLTGEELKAAGIMVVRTDAEGNQQLISIAELEQELGGNISIDLESIQPSDDENKPNDSTFNVNIQRANGEVATYNGYSEYISEDEFNKYDYNIDENRISDIFGLQEDGSLPENASPLVQAAYEEYKNGNTSAALNYQAGLDAIEEYSDNPDFRKILEDFGLQPDQDIKDWHLNQGNINAINNIQYAQQTVINKQNIDTELSVLSDCMVSLGIMPDIGMVDNINNDITQYRDEYVGETAAIESYIQYYAENAGLQYEAQYDDKGYISSINITDKDGNTHTYTLDKNHNISTNETKSSDGTLISSATYNEDGSYVVTEYEADGKTVKDTKTSTEVFIETLSQGCPLTEENIADSPIIQSLSNASTMQEALDSLSLYCGGDKSLARQILNGIFADKSFINATVISGLSINEDMNLTLNGEEADLSLANPLQGQTSIFINSVFDYRNGAYVIGESVLNKISLQTAEYDEKTGNFLSGTQYYSDANGKISAVRTEIQYDEEGNPLSRTDRCFNAETGELNYTDSVTFTGTGDNTTISIKRTDKDGDVVLEGNNVTLQEYQERLQLEQIARKFTDKTSLTVEQLREFSTVDYITQNNANIQEMLLNQDYNEGCMSKFHNCCKEAEKAKAIANNEMQGIEVSEEEQQEWETTRSDITSAIAQNNANTLALIAAIETDVSCADGSNIEFESTFQEIYGVEYNQEAIDLMRLTEAGINTYNAGLEAISKYDAMLQEAYDNNNLDAVRYILVSLYGDNAETEQLYQDYIADQDAYKAEQEQNEEFFKEMEYMHIYNTYMSQGNSVGLEIYLQQANIDTDEFLEITSKYQMYQFNDMDPDYTEDKYYETFFVQKYGEEIGKQKFEQFKEANYSRSNMPHESVFIQYANDKLNENMKAIGLDPENYAQTYMDIAEVAFGEDCFTQLSDKASEYILDQQANRNSALKAAKIAGTVLMVGGSIIAITATGPVGVWAAGACMSIGQKVSLGAIWAENGANLLEAMTKKNKRPGEVRQVLDDAAKDAALYAAGSAIYSVSQLANAGIYNAASNSGFSQGISQALGYGAMTATDGILGMGAYQLITGHEVSLSDQALTELLSLLSGIGGARLRELRNIYGDMSLDEAIELQQKIDNNEVDNPNVGYTSNPNNGDNRQTFAGTNPQSRPSRPSGNNTGNSRPVTPSSTTNHRISVRTLPTLGSSRRRREARRRRN